MMPIDRTHFLARNHSTFNLSHLIEEYAVHTDFVLELFSVRPERWQKKQTIQRII
jgi:hypothetical protein